MASLRTLLLLAAAWRETVALPKPHCPGNFEVAGHGVVDLVPTGWQATDNGDKTTFAMISGARREGKIIAAMESRSYFAENCSAGHYDHNQYIAWNLLGKSLSYTVDLQGAGCGCNAAMYFTSMRQNTRPSSCFDYYCDANNVCGESCAEIDIQEANMYAWHSTLHTMSDHGGMGMGYGGGKDWDGPRDFTPEEYGPMGKCIDTRKPFQVAASFPVDYSGRLQAMEVRLTQKGGACPVLVRLDSYKGMDELTIALSAGMTPIISYWKSNDMLWMDGQGADGDGPCAVDHASSCADTVKFYDFALEALTTATTPKPIVTTTPMTSRQPEVQDNSAWVLPTEGPALASSTQTWTTKPLTCSRTQKEDCSKSQCCLSAGMQCYEKNAYWAACKETCSPGSYDPEDTGDMRTPWTCEALGSRTNGTARSSSDDILMIKVRSSDVLPEAEVGSHLDIMYLGQHLRAAVVKPPSDSKANSHNVGSVLSHLMKRWSIASVAAKDERRAAVSFPTHGLSALAAAMAVFGFVAIAALRVRRARRSAEPESLMAGEASLHQPATAAAAEGWLSARVAADEGLLDFNVE